jgi:hypothetical protein
MGLMKPATSKRCTSPRTPEQRRRDDAVVLGSSLFTVFLCLFIVLLG